MDRKNRSFAEAIQNEMMKISNSSQLRKKISVDELQDILSSGEGDHSFSNYDFSGMVFDNLNFSNCIFDDCAFANVNIANIKFINACFGNSYFSFSSIEGCDFSGVYFKNCSFLGADLYKCKFHDAFISSTNFCWATVKMCVFHYANLQNTDFYHANIDYSSFPLYCGMLDVKFDDRHIIQFLYHVLSAVDNENTSDQLKEKLLTPELIDIANGFHRWECPRIRYDGRKQRE